MAVGTDLGGLASQVFFYLIIIIGTAMIAALAGFVAMVVYRWMKYKYLVEVIEQVGDTGNMGRSDVAKEIKAGGKHFLQLLKTKDAGGMPVQVPLPAPQNLMQHGNKKKIYLSRIGDFFTPMPVIRESDAKFVQKYDDIVGAMRWFVQDHQEALDTYRDQPSFWERNQVIILWGTMMLCIGVMMFILIWQLQHLNITVNSAQTIT